MPKQRRKKRAASVSARQTSPYLVNNSPFGSNMQPPIQSAASVFPAQAPVALNVPLSSLAVSGGLEGEADYLRDMRARAYPKDTARCLEDVRYCGIELNQRYEFSDRKDTGGMGDPCTTDPTMIGNPECQGKSVIWFDPNEKKSKIVKEKPCDPAKEDCTDRITNFDTKEQWKKRQEKCLFAQLQACTASGKSTEQCKAENPRGGANTCDSEYYTRIKN